MNRRARRSLTGAVAGLVTVAGLVACVPTPPPATTTTTTTTSTTTSTTTTTTPPPPPVVPTLIGRYETGLGNTSGETVAYGDGKLFVTNTAGGGSVDVVALSAPGTLVQRISTAPLLPNSVAVNGGLVAVAAEAATKTDPGKVLFFGTDGTPKGDITVGSLPDMLTFTPDGSKVLVANEGEPNSYGQVTSVDPEGSVSIVDVSAVRTGGSATVTTAGFGAFNAQVATLRSAGVRIYGPGATVAQDLEPEYIAVSPDGVTAWVTLQEANAIATVDVATATVTDIRPLGTLDMSASGNEFDASDRDGPGNGPLVGNLQSWPVAGLFQPDAIALFVRGGTPYLVSANEGDSRAYTGLNEEVRVGAGAYVLDPTAFPNAATLKANANLGRLQVTNASGDTDGDGDFDRIDMYGTRSFSVWNATTGVRVYDSGNDLEERTLSALPSFWNASNDNNLPDDRSDNKGPEPEGATVVDVDGRPVAFIGLERIGGVAAYDVSDPAAPVFNSYVNPRNFAAAPTASGNDSGPEVLTSVPAGAPGNTTGRPLLLVANEISGSVDVYQL